MQREHDGLRRQAIQITAQLPDNTADAIKVLDYARDLVTGFLDAAEPSAEGNVTPFPASASSR
jgi:hypothetical protein